MTWVDTVTPENGIADCVYRATRDTFGDAVSYTPCSTGVAESIQAVFFELPVDEQLEALGVEQSASGPMLRIRGGDLTVEPQRGDRVEPGVHGGEEGEIHRPGVSRIRRPPTRSRGYRSRGVRRLV